jgi:hypothetical protein
MHTHWLPVDLEVVPALGDGAVGAQGALVGAGRDHALTKAGATLEAAAAAAPSLRLFLTMQQTISIEMRDCTHMHILSLFLFFQK